MRVTRHPYEVQGWGVGELWVGDGRIVLAHDPPAPHPQRAPRGTPGAPTDTLRRASSRESGEFVEDLVQRLHSYFAGKAVDFGDVEIDGAGASPFQRGAAGALRAVPWGEVVTYAELAELAGHPRAARAAGTFCAQNRFSLFVPCHRVVATGGIGGYGALGVAYKRRLLGLEGHAAL